MDWIRNSIYLIPIIPLAGAILNLLFGRKLGRPAVFAIACGSVFVSFLLSVAAFIHLAGLPAEARSFTSVWYTWIHVGDFRANMAFLVDPLSSVMLLIVTGVGFLIHIYSIGYMGDDKSTWRYFGYLNLFVFAMLTLVLADNFMLMFIGWEGVGLCSYLLIGFWYTEKKNTDAGKKAFVVNRIGDWAFLAGVLFLFWELGQRTGIWTVTFMELKAAAPYLNGATIGGIGVATIVGILLFIGATGKSAQIPLYVWLPDAMAGPTPVSALIHAATMVTAGVYMIGRVHFIYDMSPTALAVVAAVGGVTAVFAATIGLVQNDIKKVLAYSTVSQLGYMFLAMGVGAYSAGIFHLMTHAFFKACLFLGSGSVILACHHEQDIQKMGGLKKFMPITYATFLASTLAIAGIFPLSGFFSKDEILWQAFASPHGHPILWALGVAAAFMTAFYMFRLVYLTFHGAYRGGHDAHGHDAHGTHGAHDDHGHGHGGTPHESPRVITFPLQVLAVLAVLAGFLNVPPVIGNLVGWHDSNMFHQWLTPSLTRSSAMALPPMHPAGSADPMLATPVQGRSPTQMPVGEPMPTGSLSDIVQATRGKGDPADTVLDHLTGVPGPRLTGETAPHLSGTTADAAIPGHDSATASEGTTIPGASTDNHAGAAPGHEAAGAHAATDVHAGAEHAHHDPALEFGLMILSLLVAISGILLARHFYIRNPEIPRRMAARFRGAYTLLFNKYYVDEIYQAVIVENFYRLMNFLAWFDRTFVDGLVNLTGRATVLWSWIVGKFDNIVVDGLGVNGLADTFMRAGRNLRLIQTGRVQSYLMIGLMGLLTIIVLRIL